MTSVTPRLITDRLAEHASHRPNQVALRCGQEVLSYARLLERVEACQVYIRSRTYTGDRIGLCLNNSLDFVVWFLAIARSGRIAMVMDPEWKPEIREAILERSPAEIIVEGKIDLSIGAKENPHVDAVSAYADFYIGFTSGTTGLPKGFRRSHRSWVLSFLADAEEFGLGPEDHVLAPGSMVHSLFLYAVIHGLFAGSTVNVMPAYAVRPMLDVIRLHLITHLYVVPAMLSGLQTQDFARAPSLKAILSGGAKLSPETRARLKEKLPLTEVIEFFGSSETSYIAVARTGEGAPADSVGRPFYGVDITIRREDGSTADTGEVGRLYVKSELTFSGYEGDDGSRLIRDGDWISVGDLVWQDPDQFLFLVGRENRMIVSSGRNIFPDEIERALDGHEAVRACAVIGLADPRREQELVAVLELDPDGTLSASDLRYFLKERLRTWQIPHRFFTISALPRTASGKVKVSAVADGTETDWTLLS